MCFQNVFNADTVCVASALVEYLPIQEVGRLGAAAKKLVNTKDAILHTIDVRLAGPNKRQEIEKLVDIGLATGRIDAGLPYTDHFPTTRARKRPDP